MKKLLFGCALIFGSFAITSCGDDDGGCKTCEINLLIVTSTTEVCQNGDDVITTTDGVDTTIPGTTVSDVVSGLESAGADCN